MDDTQGTPFDHLVLVAREVRVPWSHGTVAIGRTIHGNSRLPSPGHCTDSGLRHNIPSFCEGGLFPCPGGRLQVGHTCSGAQRAASRIIGCGSQLGTSPLPCSRVLISLRKELVHLSGALIFTTASQWTPPGCLALADSGAYACNLSGLYITAYF